MVIGTGIILSEVNTYGDRSTNLLLEWKVWKTQDLLTYAN